MENITELRKSLCDNYDLMKKGELNIKTGKELANTAGKLMSSVKLEMEYNAALGIIAEIDFMKKK